MYSVTANELCNYASITIQKSKKNYELIVNDAKCDLLKILSAEDNYFTTLFQQISFWKLVGSKQLIEASLSSELLLLHHDIDVHSDKKVYHVIYQYYKSNYNTLNILQRRYLKKKLQRFNDCGILLKSKKMRKLCTIKKKICELEQKISYNLDNISVHVDLKHNDLHISELTPKTYEMYMRTISCSQTRQKLESLYYKNETCEKNSILMIELILLRYTFAKILKNTSYIEHKLEHLLTKVPLNVKKFLDCILPESEQLFLEEMRMLLKLKEEHCNSLQLTFDGKIHSWDIEYYYDKLERRCVNIDDFSNYFSMDQMLRISFNLCSLLFDITFVKVSDVVWNDTVSAYSVIDNKTKQRIGTIYLDLFSRSGKTNKTTCHSFIPYCEYRVNEGISAQQPIMIIVANFGNQLSHSELVDYFDKLAYAMHGIFGRTEFAMLSGYNINLDMIDCWPNMFKNWAYEHDILVQFQHCKTKEKMSSVLANKLIKLRHIRNGYVYKKRIMFYKYDMTIHGCIPFIKKMQKYYLANNPKECLDLLHGTYRVIYNTLLTSKKIRISKYSLQNTSFIPANDMYDIKYDAIQYVKLWNEMYSDDIYYSMFKNDIFNKESGVRFRKEYLSIGDAINIKTITESYLKRNVYLDSFFENKLQIIRDLLCEEEEDMDTISSTTLE